MQTNTSVTIPHHHSSTTTNRADAVEELFQRRVGTISLREQTKNMALILRNICSDNTTALRQKHLIISVMVSFVNPISRINVSIVCFYKPQVFNICTLLCGRYVVILHCVSTMPWLMCSCVSEIVFWLKITGFVAINKFNRNDTDVSLKNTLFIFGLEQWSAARQPSRLSVVPSTIPSTS